MSVTAKTKVGQVDAGRDRLGLAAPFGTLVLVWLATSACLAIGFIYALRIGFQGPEAKFLLHQDLPVLGLCVAITAALAFTPAIGVPRLRAALAAAPGAWALGLAMLCGAIGILGAPLVFAGYHLALDEFMANFDATIFAHGQLMAPIAPAWRPLAPALQPMFTVPVAGHAFWASGYLPINAAMRALGALAGLEAWVNPLLSALSVGLVYAVGRRLWPERPGLALGAAALLATSSQLIVMSMTAYAMPGHLAFDLAWLWLFLRGGRLGHAGAIAVGFLATGLHQLLFHPLFVAPFVLQLWLDRRWRLAGLYTIAYALIGLFWTEWFQLDMRLVGISPAAASAVGGGWMVERVMQILSSIRIQAAGQMGLCLIRFVTWQNPLTAPLAIAGALAAERAKGHMRALVLGVFLTLAAMLFLMPTQTHGWGYRYAHGLLGSVCLIAIWTWARLTDPLPAPRRAAAGAAFVIACAASLFFLTPLRAWQAWLYVHPYAQADRIIHAAPADAVLVDDEGTPGFDSGTVVRNDPYLRNRPKVMELSVMTGALVRQVCARGSVRVFDGREAAALGMDIMNVPVESHTLRLRALMAQLHCGKPIR